ncbi:hypothetical protein PR202_ga02015 [Eleusine coracana subsp. coracana]|uniref:Glucose-methanol-choline oxidoreductase N-terminal domain-containing protein n=1 Tax=Eleusine coracana subsp. coracana TaxID=191504 RepID=A0AAV5BJS8_ELECO|nr:hypothetical protein PR202_ga01328 [Eleusine coracana subsp. coracana]GJM86182.1 hypothetical protein PR202_ga02015 [Eleusine coracana subsp. coracana]
MSSFSQKITAACARFAVAGPPDSLCVPVQPGLPVDPASSCYKHRFRHCVCPLPPSSTSSQLGSRRPRSIIQELSLRLRTVPRQGSQAAMGAAGEEQATRRGHPLLRGVGKRDRYTHGFSASQMAALTALCGAFVPSLPPPGHQNQNCSQKEEFFLASGGEPPVPDEVAELMSRMCLPEALALVRTVLWLLGTRLGSLALCGALCLSWRFPFVRGFTELPVEEREGAMRRWSRQTVLPPLRMFFLVTKVFCLYVFYSMTDEKSENPHWRAIGYSPPTDEAAPEEEDEESLPKKRPLDDGVVETVSETDASLPASLRKKGLTVSDDSARNTCVVECDAVVVGSGCGGGVAAAVLAAAGYKVLVIEKGSYFTSRDYTGLEGPSMAHLYESGGFVSTLSGSALILAGATVGGGSAVNWSACIRNPRRRARGVGR